MVGNGDIQIWLSLYKMMNDIFLGEIMKNKSASVFSVCSWYCVPVKEYNSVIIKLSCKQPPFEHDKISESPFYSFPINEIPNIINTLQQIYDGHS